MVERLYDLGPSTFSQNPVNPSLMVVSGMSAFRNAKP